jgi:hypothetical protein
MRKKVKNAREKTVNRTKETGVFFLGHRGYFWVGLALFRKWVCFKVLKRCLGSSSYFKALGSQQREINFTGNFIDYRGYL